LLLKYHEEPEEAESGQGEITMRDPDSNLVQHQLSELTQQVVNVIQACNEEKDILEGEFNLLKN